MLIFVKLLAPVIAGGVAAGAVTFGAVQLQTGGTPQPVSQDKLFSYAAE